MSSDRGSGHDIDWLLAPVGLREFASEHWDRSPLYVGNRGREYYKDLFSIHDLDSALNGLSIRPPFLRVVRDGKELALASLASEGSARANMLEEVFSHYRQGASIVSQFLHEQSRDLNSFSRAISTALSARAQINAYMTPRDERGLDKHFDTHDVFVLQIDGRKAWTLYERIRQVPFQGERPNQHVVNELKKTKEITLSSGDLLYIPRGFVHKAEGLDLSSLHLTVGVHPLRWAQVIHGAVTELLTSDPRFRGALPAGFAISDEKARASRDRFHELWSVVKEAVSPGDLLERATRVARHGVPPSLEGHLVDLNRLNEIDVGTRLRIRPGIQYSVSVDDEVLDLEFSGKILSMPSVLMECVRFIMEEKSFVVGDLSDALTANDKLTFARRLVKEGLLTFEA